MPEARPSPILLNRAFEDFDELANEVRCWDLDLRQLDRGRFEGQMLQAAAGKILFAEARFGRTLDQKGSAPPGLRTIAIPAGQDVRFNWRKKTITGSDMLIFPRHGDWESYSQPDFHVFIMSLPECLLQEAMEAADLCEVSELLEAETVSCSPTKMASLREKLREFALSTRENDSLLADAKVLHELEYDLPKLFVDAMLGSRSSHTDVTSRRRGLAIERAIGFISENVDEPVTIRDVCQAADVSERTLQYSFMEHVGILPKAYLTAVRLNGVRRELKNGQPDVVINQVAIRWGFWHMSQFAADYQTHFGELPSETVRQVVHDL